MNHTHGMIASPNPSFPQDVKVVTGENQVVVGGKNIWNKTFQVAERNTSTGALQTASVWVLNTEALAVNPNTTYTVSQAETPCQYRVFYFNGTTYVNYSQNNIDTTTGYKKFTFTTPNNCTNIYIQFRSTLEIIASTGGYAMNVNAITNVQVEENSTSTTYEAYKTPITYSISLGTLEFAKIVTYADKLYKDLSNGKWYIDQIIGKKVLNGTETWNGQAGSHTVVLNTYTSMSNWGGTSSRQPVYCNYLIYNSAAGVNNDSIINILSPNTQGTNLLVDVSKTEFPNLNSFTAWLGSHNLIVYYVLATTNTVEITDTTLISQLEAIHLETGTNVIEFQGDTLTSKLDVDYIKEASPHL